MSAVEISLVISTFRRARTLQRTLCALSELITRGVTWELVLVDNAGDDATRLLCTSFENRLPIRFSVSTRPGKNAALNDGLKQARGELVLLSDDDVLPESAWLTEMYEGAKRWPQHVLFGGRVLPEWPGSPPPWEMDADLGRWSYSICDPDLPEGPCEDFRPLGPNMAVRRSLFDGGLRFCEEIGPKGANYAMGSETELVQQLRVLGHQPVFLPRSRVFHIIRPDQLDHSWIIGRAYRQGRGLARLRKRISWFETARLAKHAAWSTAAYYHTLFTRGRSAAFRKCLTSALTRGSFHEALRMKLGRG
jgi:GT2 family glycosyltransferase